MGKNNLHSDIMNIQVDIENILDFTFESGVVDGATRRFIELAYKKGHKDAIHAAAELTLKRGE